MNGVWEGLGVGRLDFPLRRNGLLEATTQPPACSLLERVNLTVVRPDKAPVSTSSSP